MNKMLLQSRTPHSAARSATKSAWQAQPSLILRWLIVVLLPLMAGGCASLVSSVTADFAQSISTAVLENDDPEMVRDGAPTFLILLDSLLSRNPDDPQLLQQAASLNSAYAGAFVEDEGRAKLLSAKAKKLSLAAMCASVKNGCDLDSRPFKEVSAWVAQRPAKDVPIMYNVASSWAGWIQANTDDFSAIAELARVRLLMERVAELEPEHEDGNVFLFLGVLETLAPPALGGRPELGRSYFERAIDGSDGQNLMAKVMFARQYARLVFDQELHDRLLNEVLAADANAPGLTLSNTLAQRQAQQLLDSSHDYF